MTEVVIDVLAIARELAQVGPVLPVNGKVPMWKEWQKRASREVDGDAEWKNATGVGLLTGERAGYFVLDVDGAEGAETLAAWEREHSKLPLTWIARTGSGGLHFFFKHPGFPVRGNAGKLGVGIDVRGEGGQVVGAGSRHQSGAVYAWETGAAPRDGVELASAPAWLLEMVRPARAAQRKASGAAPSTNTRGRAYALAALDKACRKIAGTPERERNDTLNREAFGLAQLVAGGMLDRATVEAAIEGAADRCGLPPREVAATLRSAFGAGENSPRGVPPSPASSAAEKISPASLETRRISLDRAKQPPAEQFLVGVLFPLAKASVFYGPQGAGKSAAFSQLAMKVAENNGGHFLGMPVHTGGPVLVCSAEDTFEDWERKAGAVLAGCPDIDVARALDNLHIYEKREGIGRLTEIAQIRSECGLESITRHEHRPTPERLALIERARRLGAVLIIIETASRFVEEETNEGFAALLSAAGHIAAETGAAVIISHHPTKAATKENDSSPEAARGGGAFVNNSRTAVSLYPATEEQRSALCERGLDFATKDVLVFEHQKGTSSVPRQDPIILIRCSTPHGAVLQLPERVAADPRQAAVHADRAARQHANESQRFATLYDLVSELRVGGLISKNKLRPHHGRLGVAKNDVDALVDRALLARPPVLKAGRTDAAGRLLSLELGTRPGTQRFDARATAGDPEHGRVD